ncbi:MAG TPA: glycosyltransferase family 2 protein [Candidatus Kryptobacter bacterium]|nr:glycosyltransferase family 2 protein [Candidatus Kryptobacter bacterium]
MSIDLSAIVVTFNSADSIERCLSSILPSSGGLQCEIIVVDNNSRDNTLSLVQKSDRVKVIENGNNVGFAAACNIGARAATGTNLLFLNPDAYVLGGAIRNMASYESSVGGGSIIGGLVVDYNGNITPSVRSFPSLLNQLSEALFLYKLFPGSKRLGAYYYSNIGRDISISVDAVEGSFLMIPRLVFKQLNGFDEHFFLYSEDTDLCYRARKLNVPVIFFPGSRAVHAGQNENARVSRRYILAVHLAQLKFIRRHFSGFRRAGLETMKIAGLLIRVPLYLIMSVATLRLDLAKKSLFNLEAAVRGVFTSDIPSSLYR